STFARSYDAHPRDLPSFPTDALPICAATTNGAIKLNLQNRIGSLEAGKDADMVILNSNPMDSISNTADIWRVVRRGQSLEWRVRSEEHTSELQSRENLVCRLLLEKKK